MLFAVIHTQYDAWDMSLVFLMGVLFAGARAQFNSVIPSMAMHAFVNTVAFVETALIARTWKGGMVCPASALPGWLTNSRATAWAERSEASGGASAVARATKRPDATRIPRPGRSVTGVLMGENMGDPWP